MRIVIYWGGGLTFGGGIKNLVGGLLGRDFFQMGEDDQFLKHIVQKHTQANLQNLLNG